MVDCVILIALAGYWKFLRIAMSDEGAAGPKIAEGRQNFSANFFRETFQPAAQALHSPGPRDVKGMVEAPDFQRRGQLAPGRALHGQLASKKGITGEEQGDIYIR